MTTGDGQTTTGEGQATMGDDQNTFEGFLLCSVLKLVGILGGFHLFPFVSSLWSRLSSLDYKRGPLPPVS